MVACWVPETAPVPGMPFVLEYRLRWILEGVGPPGARVVATRRGKSGVHEPGFERFVVDFACLPLRLVIEPPRVRLLGIDVVPGAADPHVFIDIDRIEKVTQLDVKFTAPPIDPDVLLATERDGG